MEDNLSNLKGLYTENDIKNYKDEDLAWIFFKDGCAVLYFMEKLSIKRPQELKIKVDQLLIVQQDLLLLENQLPFLVLKLLSNDESQLLSVINKFFTFNLILGGEQGKENSTICKEANVTMDQPTHLLHYLRNEFIKKKLHNEKTKVEGNCDKSLTYTHRNVQELKESGIQVKSNKKNAMCTHISFKTSLIWGSLYLPEINMDDFTAPTLLNMIAFEMCPDFENNYEIISYVVFMDSLIDNIDDVKDLRKAKVLHNALGSDEEVAKLFNTISTHLVPDEEIYREIRLKIEDHYTSKYKTWMAQAYYKYLSNPWSFFALFATFIALSLTSIQTWYAIPSHNAKMDRLLVLYGQADTVAIYFVT